MRERDVYWMHAFRREDIYRSGERCRRRRYNDRETAIIKFLNNECGHQRLFNFSQCRLPHPLLITARQLLSQTAKECVPWDFVEKRLLHSFPGRSSCWCTDSGTEKETYSQNQKKREDMFSR